MNPQITITLTGEGVVSIESNITNELVALGLLSKALTVIAKEKPPQSPILKAVQMP